MSTHSRRYVVEPQRRVDSAWQACEPYQAQRFAVVGLKSFKLKGKSYTSSQVHSSWTNNAQAQATADTLNGALRPAKRKLPKLGERFPHDGVTKIIARGVGRNHRKDF